MHLNICSSNPYVLQFQTTLCVQQSIFSKRRWKHTKKKSAREEKVWTGTTQTNGRQKERMRGRSTDLTYSLNLHTIKPPAGTVAFNPPPLSDLNSSAAHQAEGWLLPWHPSACHTSTLPKVNSRPRAFQHCRQSAMSAQLLQRGTHTDFNLNSLSVYTLMTRL